MKTILWGLIFFSSSLFFAQTENLDTLKLLNGETYLGSVEKVKTDVVEFKEKDSGLLYEFKKDQIWDIALSNGKILTFDKKSDPQIKTSEEDTAYFKSGQRNFLYLGGGIGIPLSPDDFSDYWETGYNIGVDFTVGISPVIGIGVAVDYNSFGLNSEKLFNDAGLGDYNINVSGGQVNILSITADLKIGLTREAFQPFISLGIGYHNTETSDVTISLAGFGSQTAKGSSEDGLTYNLGIGFNIPISKNVYLFLEGKYRSVKVTDESLNSLPLKTGIAILL